MRELKKNKEEIQRILKSAKDTLEEEKKNFSKCTDIEIQKYYAKSINRIQKIVKDLESEFERAK